MIYIYIYLQLISLYTFYLIICLEKRSTGKSGGVGKSNSTVHAGIAKRGISISSSKLY